jgi:adenylate cyclase
MATRFRPTLGQVFFVTIAALAVLLAVLVSLFFKGSRDSIVSSSEQLRELRSKAIGEGVESYLHRAEQAVEHIENQIRFGACHSEDALSVEASLFAEVLNDPDLAEVAFTHAIQQRYEESGRIVIAPEARWQVSVFRETAADESPILTRFTYAKGGRFVSALRMRAARAGLLEAPLARQQQPPPDPTEHLTFLTPAAQGFRGQRLWSDLSYTELDARLPEARQRVVVTVMKAIEDRSGRFVGVVRIALLERELDRLTAPRDGEDAYRIFLCDDQGRLITRVAPGDHLADLNGDLRIVSSALPVEVAMALGHPSLQRVRPQQLLASAAFDAHGRRMLLSFRGLPATQGWRVGMVVAEEDLQGIKQLVAAQRRLMRWSLALISLILAGGALTLRAVRRGLKQVVDQAARMRNFDFAPSEPGAPFRDLENVMDSVELAKTAMRAMGKYVPVDLVRHLYQTKREPVLGGELLEVTLMFTDIKDFTSYAERLAPNALAEALGLYLEAMTDAVHATGGTIDKYIGDAVMAIWNAPSPAADHVLRGCRAALACVAASERLYASPAWRERPRFVTRFGLHSDKVMVGHFGAPDRMSYTALGDGVNLASRLEGLNKQYGTTLLVSETVQAAAKQEFRFRLLDRVAVKGKTRGIAVYELLGDAASAGPRIAAAGRYEDALQLYFARRFPDALAILEEQPDDPPSGVLAERCRTMQKSAPPPDWDGIYVSRTK